MYSYTSKRIIIVLSILLWADISFAWPSSKQSEVKKGNQYYMKGDYDQSIEKYKAALKKDPESDIINFNLGTALYKKGQYKEAVDHLQKSLLSSSEDIRSKAAYNIGNAIYKDAVSDEDKDVDVAIKKLENLLSNYQKILELNKNDPDAKANYEFFKKELARLKKKEEKLAKNKGGKDGFYMDEQKKGQESSNDSNENQQNQIKQDPNSSNSMVDKNGKEEVLDPNKEDAKKDSQDALQDDKQKDSEDKSKENSANGKTGNSQENEKKVISQDQNLENKLYVPAKAGELTDKESKMLLEHYEQNEAPKGMFQMKLQKSDSRGVDKDW